ncbi:MAG: hypothetical protein UY48_C0008G0013 [Candidatus Gottesmanbacteria bacterium GW2011_GWB1_49_7]|uniref:Uncharacterized protein n=1 Tax=Candidatus Gottesmanbacteria bacterium GW2011_GWB1_49_7 TaxID=1618448 RepID=A0A0G1W298_9BACT|nr:MAG: hypothetical protein UY48_C0008G0013 [Candidatus Gottesmanbacteria bacterium GW2011_GWB1_49_7]
MTLVYLFHTGRAWMVFLPNGQQAKVWWRQSQNINWRPQAGYYSAHKKWDGSFMIDTPWTPLPPMKAPNTQPTNNQQPKGLVNKVLGILGLQKRTKKDNGND